MNIKRVLTVAGIAGCFIFILPMAAALAQDMHMGGRQHHHMMDGPGMMGEEDKREKLAAKPMMRDHLKRNMREHLKTINETLLKMGAGDFSGASAVLHERLGISEEMKRMCGMFGNDAYRQMGIAMHENADEAAKVIAAGDMKKSVAAVGSLLSHCAGCHEMFRVE